MSVGHRWSSFVAASSLGLLILIADLTLPARVASELLYVPAICIGYRLVAEKHDLVILTVVFSSFLIFGHLIHWTGNGSRASWLNLSLALAVIWITSVLLLRLDENMAKRASETTQVLHPIHSLVRQLASEMERQDAALERLARLLRSIRLQGEIEEAVLKHMSEVVEIYHRIDQGLQAADVAMYQRLRHTALVTSKPRMRRSRAAVAIAEPPALENGLEPVRSPDIPAKQSRRPFRYKQSIAPFVGDQAPALADFYEVQGCDIAPDGFSFIATERPRYLKLVIALGPQSQKTYLTARVVAIAEPSGSTKGDFRVDCEFLEKIEASDLRQRLTKPS